MNSTDIESDAITNFRTYLKGCPNISAHISENDRGISWDGFLDMFSDGVKDKNHYVDHIYIQIKGRIVDKLKDECKYPIDKSDLELYRTEPVIYVVCQMESRVSEYNLFYRSLLPETIKNLLKGKDKQKTVSVAMKKMPGNARDFEDVVSVFIADRKRQVNFAKSKTISLDEAKRRGIKEFQLTLPSRPMTQLEQFSYLSTHPSFIYAVTDPELKITIPIEGGQMALKFQSSREEDIIIGDKSYKMPVMVNVENGQIVMNIGKVIQMRFSDPSLKEIKCSAQLNSEYLNERLAEAEFLLSVVKAKTMVLREYTFRQENMSNLDNLEKQYNRMIAIKQVLDALHISKPLNFVKMSQSTDYALDILYDSIVLKHKVTALKDSEGARILSFEDIHVLLWIQRQQDGLYSVDDLLGGQLQIVSPLDGGRTIDVSPYSYLTKENKWAEVDNINYTQILPYAQKMVAQDKSVIPWVNEDILAMVVAADQIVDKDKTKYCNLLNAALSITNWLLSICKEYHYTYELNQLQIYKRQGIFTDKHISRLKVIVKDKTASNEIVAAAYLLMGDKSRFIRTYNKLSAKDQQQFMKYPIGKFVKELD